MSELLNEDINLQYAINVKFFWKDKGVQKCYKYVYIFYDI